MHKKQSTYRIGIDARFFRGQTSGLGRYSHELIRHLALVDTENHYSVFLTPEDMPEWDIEQENFHPVMVDAPHYSGPEQTVLLKALNKERLDLVHFLNFNHPLLYRKPFITTLHDLTIFHYPAGKSQKSLARRIAFKLVFSRSLKKARRVIAISEHTAKDAEKQFRVPHSHMEVIYEAGPTPPAEWPFGNRAAVQKYLGRKEPYFLFVSQWRSHKGILTLIKAFERFKKATGYPHVLVLAGNPKTIEQTVKVALAESPYGSDIVTPGFVPDDMLPMLYHNAVAMVFPSEYEGFGLPILEAFAYGAPVIASDNTSIPELVGRAGILVPTGDEATFAEAMQRLAEDEALATDLIAKGYKQNEKFSWYETARKTHEVYMRVLEKCR